MEDNKISVSENQVVVDEGGHCTGEDGHESLTDVEKNQIFIIEGSRAEIEDPLSPLHDWAEAVDKTEDMDSKGWMDEKIRKDVEKYKGEKMTSIVHDTDNKNNARRMENYVSFVNRNWKQALTKFEKKKCTEVKYSSNDPSKDNKQVNTASDNQEATEGSKYCSTPDGLLHNMWLHSLAKGEVVMGKGLPRKKPQSPYLVFCKEKEKEFSHLTWKEFGVLTRKAWKELGDKEREKFKEKCKEMWKKEREKFLVGGDGTPEKKTEEIKVMIMAKHVLKKARSAFSIYMDSLSKEVSKLDATTRWNGLNDEEQKEFIEKEREELECCKMEMKEQKNNKNKMRKRKNRVKNMDIAGRENQGKYSVVEKEGGDVIKKPRSAFSIFMDEIVKEMKSPDGKEDAEDVKKRVNNQWRRLGKKEKEAFRARAVEEWTLAQPKEDVKKVVTREEGGPVVGAKGESAGDGIPTTGPAKDGIPNTGHEGDDIPTTGSAKDSIPTTGSAKGSIPTTGPAGDGIPSTGPVGDGIPTTGPVGDGIQTSGPVGDGIPTAGPVGDGIPTTGPVGDGIPTTGPVGDDIPTTGPAGDGIQTTGPVKDSIPTTGLAEDVIDY